MSTSKRSAWKQKQKGELSWLKNRQAYAAMIVKKEAGGHPYAIEGVTMIEIKGENRAIIRGSAGRRRPVGRRSAPS